MRAWENTNQRTSGEGVLLCSRHPFALPAISKDICLGKKQLVLSPWMTDIAEQQQQVSFPTSPRRHQNLNTTVPSQSAKNQINKMLLLVTLSSSPHHVRLGCSPTLQGESNNRPSLRSLPVVDHFVSVVIERGTAGGTNSRNFKSFSDKPQKRSIQSKTPGLATPAAIKAETAKAAMPRYKKCTY